MPGCLYFLKSGGVVLGGDFQVGTGIWVHKKNFLKVMGLCWWVSSEMKAIPHIGPASW